MAYYATGVAAVGVGTSIFGGVSAKKAQKKAAKQQARLTKIQRTEEIRQKTKAAGQQLGAARAGVYANNLIESGSPANYVNALDMENTREIAYAKMAAEQEQKAIKAGARGAGNALFMQAGAQALQAGIGFAQNYTPSPAATPTGQPGVSPNLPNGAMAPAPVPTNVPMSPVVNR
jgi:hypothetical protein